MPTLEWIGKDKVINHHQEVPFRILDKKYTYNAESSENMIIHGDNLLALKSLLPQYEGKVDCIYIDPPYNTGNEKWVYNDNVNDPRIKKWLGEVVGQEGEDLSRHDKWLCMMYPRLKLLHKLLSSTGVIFISIDDNELIDLKQICNEIFGGHNFVATLVWQKRKGGGNDSSFFAVDHEYILCYVKDVGYQTKKWRVPYKEDYLKRYKYEDNDGRYYYDTLSRPGLNNPIIYDVICPDGSIIKDGTWQISEDSFKEQLKSGKVDFIKNKSGGFTVVHKVYAPSEGKVFRSILSEVSNKDAADEMEIILGNKKIFSTPKPVDLIATLLQLSVSKDAIILDSFAGSGTTAHAVLNLNKKDSGNRKFILVEMMDYADTITAERVKRVIDGYGEGNKAVEGLGGDFSYYELGAPLFKEDKNLNEEVGEEEIRKYVYYMETKKPIETNSTDNRYYMGKNNDTAYYFYYEKDKPTTLNREFLATVKTEATGYVIYADICALSKEMLSANGIVFKKIPRDIKRL